MWSDAVYTQPGLPPTRGFGGRLYFYDAHDQPVKVEGQLVVYAYDDSPEGTPSFYGASTLVLTHTDRKQPNVSDVALDERLGKVPHLSAAAVRENGDPVLIIDTEDVIASLKQSLGEGSLRGARRTLVQSAGPALRALVVDDSATVREVERQLLARMGFEVETAVDGMDGWNTLRAGRFDLVVSDIDMPRMNGIEFVRTLRADARFAQIPVIVVSYKDREEDRRAGMDAGANAYLTKGSFQDQSFIATVTELVGAP